MVLQRVLCAFAAACLIGARPALAWNKPGHMIVGAIAYDVLKQDSPETIARIVELLKSHPEYETFKTRLQTVPPADGDRYLFMQAARWPDDARDNPKYHHGPWHYIDNPLIATGDDGKVTPPAPETPNILTALKENEETLRTGTPAEKAIAICWLIHLVGDVHQPLHTVSFYSVDRPKGDRGGNTFFARVAENRAVINLHTLWDGLLTGGQSYRNTGNIAIELRKRPDFAREKLTELAATDFDAWAKESVTIARDVVYTGGTLKGGTDRGDGPVLPEGYAKRAKAIAERRVVLAGYRLADVLKRAAAQ